MRKANKRTFTRFNRVITYEAEPIERKVERITSNKEPIEDAWPTVYTNKKDGVIEGYDIRTDRFEIARVAMEKQSLAAAEASKIAAGQQASQATAEDGVKPS